MGERFGYEKDNKYEMVMDKYDDDFLTIIDWRCNLFQAYE